MKNELTISKNDEWRKLEKVVKKYFQDLSLWKINKLFREWEIKINKKKAKKDDIIMSWDILTVYTKEETKISTWEKKWTYVSERFFTENFHIIYEDDDILAVNKPAWIAVHPWSGHHYWRTMIDLAEHYINMSSNDWFIQLAHRLDADTSWVLLFAKNGLALRNINDQMKKHETEKYYYALVFGKMPKSEWTIKTEIERVEWDKFNKIRIVGKKTSASKTSITEYKVISFNKEARLSLLDINIKTWRMHQIRVHMKSQWTSLVMDQIYWDFRLNRQFHKQYWLKRQFLHAYFIKFKHPDTWKEIEIKADMTKDLENVLESLSN